MIAKVRLGRSFGSSVRYLMEGRHSEEQKVVDKQAELLASNGIRRGSVGQMASDFNRQRSLNPDLKVAVWHTALSFSPQDAPLLTNELMVDVARQYLTKLNIDPAQTQWLLVRHNDRTHPHAHLVLNRVDREGRTIDASFCQSRSRAAAISIAQQQGFTVSISRPTPDSKLEWEQKKASHHSDWAESKRTIFKAVAQALPQVGSLADLSDQLAKQAISIHPYPPTAETQDQVRGLAFEYKGQFVKASQLDRQYSWPTLKDTLATQQAQGIGTEQKAGNALVHPKQVDLPVKATKPEKALPQPQETVAHTLNKPRHLHR